MMPLFIVLCVIGAAILLSKYMPDILRAIPADIGLIVLGILIGGIVLFLCKMGSIIFQYKGLK